MTRYISDFVNPYFPAIRRLWKEFDQEQRRDALLGADIPLDRFHHGPVEIETMSKDELTKLNISMAAVIVASGNQRISAYRTEYDLDQLDTDRHK